MIDIINARFTGHLGAENKVAGVGIGLVYINLLFLSALWGFNGAISTLVSQAFGAGNLRLCGVYLNRGRIAISLVYVPLALLLFISEYAFQLMGFDHEASHYAGQYCKSMSVSLYFAT